MVIGVFPAIGGTAGAVTGFIVRKKVWITVTGAVMTGFYIGTELYEMAFGQEAADELTQDLKDLGFEIVDEIGDAALAFVEGFGGAVITGLDNTYDAVRDRLRGHEPDVIAGIVVAALAVGTVLFLYYNMKARALGPALSPPKVK